MSIYAEIILDHYHYPRNKVVLSDPDYLSDVSNPVCGDSMRLMLRVEDEHVVECTFDGQACAISTASASLLTTFVISKSIHDIFKITSEDVQALLGIELSPIRLKCALLPLEGIHSALKVT